MRFSVPHPIPYQGSKRRLAPAILSHIPSARYTRLVEPFAGSAAITLAAASRKKFDSYVIGDVLEPLIRLWKMVIDNPKQLADDYETLWRREREKPIDAYYEIRSEFNADPKPARLLYLLARCVKNAVRFNPTGEFNQSPDKRRTGTRPQLMGAEIFAAHRMLAGKCEAIHDDFLTLFLAAQEGDFFYLDPPYQGTSEGRDQRYIAGVSRSRMIEALTILNEKRIPFILSYDGFCGARNYGDPLPSTVAHRILLDVGRSSQATLNGRDDITVESLYVSNFLPPSTREATTLSLDDFAEQTSLFT
ncbi:MAG TPA: Dam family site-specific DNA-(adenine-N6)-methyltransferase [Terriglobia bacterium]|nr:Dam family site-specific DNA-(adenine-N6)-methyltransferase [Terriglobia bacterium]